MAGTNIDNLNFKVILDDKDFNDRIQKDIKAAKDLNVQLSQLLQAKVKINTITAQEAAGAKRASDILAKQAIDQERIRKAANQAAVNAQRFRTEQQRTATEAQRTATATQNTANATARAELAQRRLRDYSSQTARHIQTQSRLMNELKGYALGYLSIHGASRLLSSLVRVTGEFELQKTTLAAMLGDLNQAEGIITRIQGLAVESPFQFKELTTYAKQLSAFSVPAQELYDTTKMLADVSAGLGVGMDRIVLAYGQVRSAAFLRGQEVRQFTEAGIPILNELAKQFSELEGRAVSTSEVFDKISKRLVPFEMVAKVFKDMTSEGGKFYNMQEVQAETLRGKISNLKDAYEVMLNEIGKGQSENLKGAVDWARRLMQNYEETGRAIAELVIAYGVYKAALLTLTIATNNFALANSKLYTSIINATKWAINNPYVVLAAGITAAGYAIYKNITALEGYEKVHKSFVDTENKYNAALSAEEMKLDTLYAKLRLAKEGTEEYEEAKKQIYTQYSGYISELKAEGVEVGNLVTLYDSLKIKVQEYTQAKFRSLAQTDLDQTFEQEVKVVRDRYKTLVSEIESIRKNAGEEPLSAEDKVGLWQYITGDIATLWDMAEKPGLDRIKKILASKILPFGDIAKELQGDLRKIKSTYAQEMQAIIDLYGETSDELEDNNPFKIPLGGEDGGKSPAQKAIEGQIRSVQKLQDAYEKLMPYLNEVQMKSTLKALFPNIEAGVIDSLDFDAELERLADELEKFDEDAAQRLRDAIGKDVAGTISESFKAVEQYKKMLDSWLGEDFNLSGEGVSFDISKIISNLNNEYAKIDQKRAKALDLLNKAQMGDEVAVAKVRETLGEEVWQKYLENGTRVIDELAVKEKQSAKQTADEKIKDLASKYVKEQMTAKNVDLTDFEDKTISQIDTYIARIKKIMSEAQEELNKIYLGGVDESEMGSMEMFMEVMKQLKIILKDTEGEKTKKTLDNLKDGLSAVADTGREIESLGEAFGSKLLEGLGKEVADLANAASGIIEAFKAKDTISLIANVASYAISKVTDIITAAYEYQRLLTESAWEYADAMNEVRRASHEGLFGTDELALAAENMEILTEAQQRYQDALKGFGETKFQAFGGSFWRKDSIENVLGDFAEDNGWDLYLESGELNIKGLEAYFDAYSSRLTKKQRALVQNIIESGNALEDASAQQAEYLTNLFSEVADNIANSMIDAFLESGDAAIDMGNIISDVSRQMVADLIKSIYLMPILNDYKEELEKVDAQTALSPTEKTEQKLNILDDALQQISAQSDAIADTIAEFEEYLRTPEEGTDALGQGIKGITEDQANLLASYLNAIRADVSYSKTLWVRMDANLQRIADMFTSSPTLMEYQAKIAANTYDTAVATQAILARLEGIITYDSGDASIRVYS